ASLVLGLVGCSSMKVDDVEATYSTPDDFDPLVYLQINPDVVLFYIQDSIAEWNDSIADRLDSIEDLYDSLADYYYDVSAGNDSVLGDSCAAVSSSIGAFLDQNDSVFMADTATLAWIVRRFQINTTLANLEALTLPEIPKLGADPKYSSDSLYAWRDSIFEWEQTLLDAFTDTSLANGWITLWGKSLDGVPDSTIDSVQALYLYNLYESTSSMKSYLLSNNVYLMDEAPFLNDTTITDAFTDALMDDTTFIVSIQVDSTELGTQHYWLAGLFTGRPYKYCGSTHGDLREESQSIDGVDYSAQTYCLDSLTNSIYINLTE
ncbi:MAG TPA: hypothetical protein VLM37_12820, partial [Fibrobacteraceae bacterium]|nr:hypothetical protein [Fibrobacteraceae bacterium]